MNGLISFSRKFLGRQQGSMSVEFGILAPVFILLVFGIVDFGHAWYMKMEITSASRAGARYGARLDKNGNIVLKPCEKSPSIMSWVTSNYSSLLPKDANLQVTPGGTGYTSGNPGEDLTVTVSATKTWFVLDNLIPTLGNSITMTATTAMTVE